MSSIWCDYEFCAQQFRQPDLRIAARCSGRLRPTLGRIMKVRSSVKKNNWGDSREASYRAEAENIAFAIKGRLVVRDNSVYLRLGELEELLATQRQPKALWFDVWTALNERYQGHR